jgi:hypothetical protein
MIPYIGYELSAAICERDSQMEDQIGESFDPGLQTTCDIRRAESEASRRRFARRVSGVLIAVVLAIALIFLVVAYFEG